MFYKDPLDISAEDWIDLLTNREVTTEKDLEILKIVYENPYHEIRASDIVSKTNYTHHGPINSLISWFSKRVITKTTIQPPLNKDGKPRWWHVPFWAWKEENGNHYFWKLRPELVKAIESHPDIFRSSEKSLKSERKMNVWIFQSNPKYYDLIRDLDDLSKMNSIWPIRQHKKKIKNGDLALLWVAGQNRGIYATAEIISDPQMQEVDPNEPWLNRKNIDNADNKVLLVDLGYMTVLEPPLFESELKTIRELSDLSIIRQHNGTNFPVTESEWKLLSKEIEKRKLSAYPQINEDVDLDLETFEEEQRAKEGGSAYYYGKHYERDPNNRKAAIKYHGTQCSVCGFDFSRMYKQRGQGFIEIHHVKPISTYEKEMEVDPKNDLVPVCANCHRMIHRFRNNVLSVEELRKIIN
ncbi:EVE domain-containing protein [uncultured Methanoregula sp.]|uniref:EVE domain-containing protein n=1 Tax=uncultured Methanoregula sp. TaxID=1005933 RepID=UPI002AAB168D|nr:EVE domain-containing protein [uncultured Methanoregula sp.]